MTKTNANNQKKWHVIYTKSRSEKKVADWLIEKNIECYLPIQKRLRQWKDRKKWVDFPLISGYCFVRITNREHDLVLQTDHVVCFITFEGKPAIVRDSEIEFLKRLLEQPEEVIVTRENYSKGQKVEILSGPLTGLHGELVEIRGKRRFLIRLDQIQTSFTIELTDSVLKPLTT